MSASAENRKSLDAPPLPDGDCNHILPPVDRLRRCVDLCVHTKGNSDLKAGVGDNSLVGAVLDDLEELIDRSSILVVEKLVQGDVLGMVIPSLPRTRCDSLIGVVCLKLGDLKGTSPENSRGDPASCYLGKVGDRILDVAGTPRLRHPSSVEFRNVEDIAKNRGMAVGPPCNCLTSPRKVAIMDMERPTMGSARAFEGCNLLTLIV